MYLLVCASGRISWFGFRMERPLSVDVKGKRQESSGGGRVSRSFSFQTIVDFVLIFLGHALGLDHHDALLSFRANVIKHAKTEGFFQQRELRKTYTAREVCVGIAA